MKRITSIDVQESIKNEELICKLSWNEKFDRLFTFLLYLYGIYILVSTYYNKNQPIDSFLKYTIPIIFLFFCYSIYRKFIEFKLISIKTNYNKKDNEKTLLKYLKSKNCNEIVKTKDIVISNEEGSIVVNNIETIFIISDYEIFFTILKQGYRIDPPTLFSHIKLRKELNTYFKNNNL